MSIRAMTLAFAALATTIFAAPAWADSPRDEANLAIHSARIEALRARAAHSPSANATATLIESENLLRQLRAAPPDKRSTLRAQLDAVLTRLELEIDAAGRGRP